MNFNELFKYIKQPRVFEEGTSNFWDDPYISRNMLDAHLNPNWDAASRKPKTIDKTVAWLRNLAESKVLTLNIYVKVI